MKTVKISLSSLCPGQTAVVKTLCLPDSIRRRLQEMGLISGTKITCLRHAPAGSPGAYQFRDCVVSLRKTDAARVEVSLWG